MTLRTLEEGYRRGLNGPNDLKTPQGQPRKPGHGPTSGRVVTSTRPSLRHVRHERVRAWRHEGPMRMLLRDRNRPHEALTDAQYVQRRATSRNVPLSITRVPRSAVKRAHCSIPKRGGPKSGYTGLMLLVKGTKPLTELREPDAERQRRDVPSRMAVSMGQEWVSSSRNDLRTRVTKHAHATVGLEKGLQMHRTGHRRSPSMRRRRRLSMWVKTSNDVQTDVKPV
jgi:hypothetical protein